MVDFAHPFWLFLLLPLLLWAVWLGRQRRMRARRLREMGWPSLRNGRSRTPLLQLAALALGVIALAGPQWGRTVTPVQTKGVQLLVLLDVSQSMLAADAPGSRLAQAQAVANTAADALAPGDHIGLLLFAGESRLWLPLTTARTQFDAALAAAHPTALAQQGTLLAPALETAVRAFHTPVSGQPLLLLISDGENHGDAPQRAAQAAAAAGMRLFTVGVGSAEGATIPTPDGDDVQRDAAGEPIRTRLEPAALQAIAAAGNGRYLSAAAALTELPPLLAEIRAAHTGTTQIVQPNARYQLFLLPAALLWGWALLPPLLPRGRKRPSLAWLLLGLALLGCRQQSPAHWVTAGNDAFANADYAQAIAAYETAAALAGETAVPHFNRANVQYRLQQYAQAAQALDPLTNGDNAALSDDALFNLGNAHFQLGDYDAAADAYRALLRRRPDHADAKHNLELTLSALAGGGGSDADETGAPTPLDPLPDGERPLTLTGDGDDTVPAQPAADAPPLPLSPAASRDLLTTAAEDAAGSVLPAPAAKPERMEKDW